MDEFLRRVNEDYRDHFDVAVRQSKFIYQACHLCDAWFYPKSHQPEDATRPECHGCDQSCQWDSSRKVWYFTDRFISWQVLQPEKIDNIHDGLRLCDVCLYYLQTRNIVVRLDRRKFILTEKSDVGRLN